MVQLPRRRFLLKVAGLLPLPFVARRLHSLATADLDPRLLRALASAILPTELGDAGIDRTVAGFRQWLDGYREGVELLHGYGTGELRTTGPSPALRWAGQLDTLDAAARKGHNAPFDRLNLAELQALVRNALQNTRLGSLLQFDRAPHLALGLLGYFYTLPEATDLCYRSRIGPNTCRPLSESGRRPLPLAGNP